MTTPSQEITRLQTVSVEDVQGRKIEVRNLKPFDRMRLFELIGAENAMNQPYLGFATLAYSVVSINGDQVPRPTTKLQLEAIVNRLDDDGFDAVSKAVAENFLPQDMTRDEATAAVKNG